MNRIGGLILVLTVAAIVAPATADAQQNKPSNNMWTRSAALYLDRARTNPRPEEKRELYQQALEAALEGTQKDPDNPKVWFMAGQAFIKLGDYARADSVFDRAEALYPEYDEIRTERNNAWILAYNAGVAALQQGKLEEAVSHMERADLIYQRRPSARLNLGSLYARLGDHEKAITAYRGALEVLRGPMKASLSEKEAAEWTEHEEIATFNLAQILAGLGRDEEAAQAYRDYLAREPDNIAAKINLAVVLARQERHDEAAEIFDELLARTDLQADEYFRVGVGLFRAERYDRAAEAFQRSLELNPHTRDAWYNLAQALYAPTLDLEERRATAEGEEATTLAAELKARYERMAEAVDRLLAIDPQNSNSLLLLARAYRGLADLHPDRAASDTLRNKALAVLERQQNLGFELQEVTMELGENEAVIRGAVFNLALEEGTPIRLQFEAVDPAGASLGTQEVSVTAPVKDGTASFEARIPVEGTVAGWKYQVLQ